METRTGKVFGKTILTLSKWRVNVFSYIVGCSNAFFHDEHVFSNKSN